MKLPTLSPYGRPRSTAEVVVWALAHQPVMTFRQLCSIVRQSRGISAQGMWKVLRGLMKDGVVSRIANGEYSLSRKWITDLKCWCETIEQNHQCLKIIEGVITCRK